MSKSGKFMVRVPIWLHEALAEQAKKDGVSLNLYVNSICAGAVGRKSNIGAYPPWSSKVEAASPFNHRLLGAAIEATRDAYRRQTVYQVRVDDRIAAELGATGTRNFVEDAFRKKYEGEFVAGTALTGSGTGSDPIQIKLDELKRDEGDDE